MNQIEYRTGSLFDAPPGALLVHACNSQGVWGSGIALEFKKRFPEAYKYYKTVCDESRHDNLVGHIVLPGDSVACLITSWGYGQNVSPPHMILQATETAFRQLLRSVTPTEEIHMPMINSGLFRVPWEQTECILNKVLAQGFTNKCVVWRLE